MDHDDDCSGDNNDGPVKTPTEQPERLKAASSLEDLKADLEAFKERSVVWRQKHDKLSETLKREQENTELKICKMNADVDKGEYKGLSTEMVEVMMLDASKQQRELSLLDLLHFREADSVYVRKIGYLEEKEVFYREKYAGDETALQQHLLRLREDKETVQNELLQIRKLICHSEESVKSSDESLAAINAKLGSDDKGSATTATSAADPGSAKTPTPTEHAPADTLLSTSVTGDSILPNGSSSVSPPSGRQKAISPLEGKLKEAANQEKQMKEAEERKAAFEELVREKQADLTKKKDVIASVVGKMEELNKKLWDMGALTARGVDIRTDLTEEKELVVAPIAATFLKCSKLKRSLTRDHDIKKCELDIEIAKFHTTSLEQDVTAFIRKIDNKIKNVLMAGGCDVERDEEQVRVYQGDLVKVLYEIDEFNSQRALLEQRLQELVAEGEGDALVPAANKPPSRIPPANNQATAAAAAEGTKMK